MSDRCANCQMPPPGGTELHRWVGEGGALALSHGMYSWWCDVCTTAAQLDHARTRAALIPEMEERLADLRARPR